MKILIAILFTFSAMFGRAEQPLSLKADLAKLSDAIQRREEVARLCGAGKDGLILTGYHYFAAKQAGGKPPLHVLCVSTDYDFNRGLPKPRDKYEVEQPQELFGKFASPFYVQLEPSLDPLRDQKIFLFDTKGREIRPFGEDSHADNGYVFDFDHDGILDFANARHSMVKDVLASVFTLQTVEERPRVLFEVIYNWHPPSANEANAWTYECFDENHDGIAEIGFGPKSAITLEDKHRFVFRFDPAKKRYSAGAIPAKSHLRVLGPGESVATVDVSRGLGYPIIKDRNSSDLEPQAHYKFKSLKDRPTAELAAFFHGKSRRDPMDGPEDSFPNRLPDHFWQMEPKQAAIALAEANRTPTNRAKWKMALDDRHGITPPKSGWLTHDWHSSSCYVIQTHLFALRFGAKDPSLIVFELNSVGVVGHNQWADKPAYQVRSIKLSDQEARFLADTIFWLDKIRTFSAEKETGFSGGSSTADGFAAVSIFPDGQPPHELAADTVWVPSSISAMWDHDYQKVTFVNLAEFLLADRLPAMLGDRWSQIPPLKNQSLSTPTEARLKPRLDESARRELIERFTSILRQHEQSQFPAMLIENIVQATGEEAIVELMPAMKKLFAALPAESAEDKEYEKLNERYVELMGSSSSSAPFKPASEPQEKDAATKQREKDADRYFELSEKRKFLPAAILREPLKSTIAKLELIQNPGALKQAASTKGKHDDWALSKLLRVDAVAWASIVSNQFKKVELQNRRMIFTTIAAAHPPAAGKLIAELTAEQQRELIIEIADYHQQHGPKALANDIQVLMDLVRNTKEDWIRRGQAMNLLSNLKLPPGTLKEFTTLLLKELKSPQMGDLRMWSTLGNAVTALTKLPEAKSHLDEIISTPQVPLLEFSIGINALAQLSENRTDRKTLLANFIRSRFTKSNGLMNSIFIEALTHDLRELAPEISAFASENPSFQDGDGSDYSGGNFKTPVGQRYHIARAITALWSEQDPVTLGRMWICLVAAYPNFFDPKNSNSSLRELAVRHIEAVPTAKRSEEINAAIARINHPDYYASVLDWLRSLSGN